MKRSYYITGNGYTGESVIEALKTVIEEGKELTLKTTDSETLIVVSAKNDKLNVAAVSESQTIISSTINKPSEFIRKFIENYYAVDSTISVTGRILNDQPAIHIYFYG